MLVVGVTIIIAVLAPLLHKYVLAPLAIKTKFSPAQTRLLLLEILTTGLGNVVMLSVEVLVGQPGLLPLTVYKVVPPGVTVITAPVPTKVLLNPVVHVYEDAPLADNVAVFPTHKELLVLAEVIVGEMLMLRK